MKFHILIVAGEKNTQMDILERIHKILPEAEYEIVDDAVYAVKAAKYTKRLDLIFLDIHLPTKDGIWTADRIREIWKECPIFFLIDYQDYKEKRNEIKRLDAGYLLKPVSETGLFYAVQQLKKCSVVPISVNENIISAVQQEKFTFVDRKRIQQYIELHCFEKLTLERVAEDLGYSKTYFSRRFKQLFKYTFVHYLTRLRIEEAKRLLMDAETEVKQIAVQTGFQDAAYFSRVFRQLTGNTPSEYRKEKGVG